MHDIKLDGEASNTVSVFDTCNDIRKKINDHLQKVPQANQAVFVRELNNVVPTTEGENTGRVYARVLRAFMQKKGPQNGAQTMAFYTAYVYFEKLRRKEGRKKGKMREEMEEAGGKEGDMPREGNTNKYITCLGIEKPKLDRLGKLQITRSPCEPGGFKRKPLK